MAEAPKIPTPDKLMEMVSRHVTQSMDVINAQLSEVTSGIGLPAGAPTLPKFALPSLPKMGQGQGGLPTLPSFPFPLPFMAPTKPKRGEERITPPALPPVGVREIIA